MTQHSDTHANARSSALRTNRAPQRQLVVELSADNAVVIDIHRTGADVHVATAHWFVRPDGVDPASASNVGAWLKNELTATGTDITPISFACRRHDAILKRIDLPGAAGRKENQLAPMVSLQMSRHVPFQMTGSATDFVPLDATELPETSAQSRMLCAVLPSDRLGFLTDISHAVMDDMPERKREPASIGLHAAGAWALLADTSRATDDAIMGIAIGPNASSIVVLEAGRMMFVRGVDVGLDREMEHVDPGALALEAKRTWMGYRAIPDAKEISHVYVLGEDSIVSPVAAAITKAMRLPAEVVGAPASIRFEDALSDGQRTIALPLAALSTESTFGVRSFDFVHPRKAPDVAQVRRQRTLIGLLALIAVVGSMGVVLSMKLDSLRDKVAIAEQKKKTVEEKLTTAILAEARLLHLERWRESAIDWLAHLDRIATDMPDAPDAQLDQWRGTMKAAALFTPKNKSYFGGKWSSQKRVDFFITGPIGSATLLASLRQQLLDTGIYYVTSNGPDVQSKFSFDLASNRENPTAVEPIDDAPAGDIDPNQSTLANNGTTTQDANEVPLHATDEAAAVEGG